MSIQRILVIDDDAADRESLSEAIIELGLRAEAASSGPLALEKLRERAYDMVLVSLQMEGMDGVEFLRRLPDRCEQLPAVLVAGPNATQTAEDAIQHGAVDLLPKPCSQETLRLVIERVAHTQRLERENEYLRSEVRESIGRDIIARSAPMLESLRIASRVATSRGAVLISGESGTGKERVAQFIHQSSSRADGPFIRVNCSALKEHLMEAELFGLELGVSAGTQARAGRFELADGGSLVLEEVSGISGALQAKLLRALEEEEFQRVGGSLSIRSDVRIIATTSRDLSEEVAAGRFREDLYYRLCALPIEVLPLRERREDVQPLAEHFAARYARKFGLPMPSFAPDAVAHLERWDWPGNSRELEVVIECAVLFAQGEAISIGDLVLGPHEAETGHPLELLSKEGDRLEGIAPILADRKLADIERLAILATIDSAGGNKTEAARRLGVTARTLSNKFKLWRQLGLVA